MQAIRRGLTHARKPKRFLSRGYYIEPEKVNPTFVGCAFKPGQFLHPEIIIRHQQNTFRRAMDENYMGICDLLTEEENAAIASKMEHIGDLKFIEKKIIGLLGQERYFHIRFSRTVQKIKQKVDEWVAKHGPESLVFGDQYAFRDFKATCDFWDTPLYSQMTDTHLRVFASAFSIESCGKEEWDTMPLSFRVGNYRHKYPDPEKYNTTEYLKSQFSEMSNRKIVILSAINAIKVGRYPSTEYLEECMNNEGHLFSQQPWKKEVEVLLMERYNAPPYEFGADYFKMNFGGVWCCYHDGMYEKDTWESKLEFYYWRRWLPNADQQEDILEKFGPNHPMAAQHDQHVPDIRDEHQPHGFHGPYDEEGRKHAEHHHHEMGKWYREKYGKEWEPVGPWYENLSCFKDGNKAAHH